MQFLNHMPKLNQKGAIQFIVLLILLGGIAGGVYLSTREEPFKLFPQAREAKVSGPIPQLTPKPKPTKKPRPTSIPSPSPSPISVFGKAVSFNNNSPFNPVQNYIRTAYSDKLAFSRGVTIELWLRYYDWDTDAEADYPSTIFTRWDGGTSDWVDRLGFATNVGSYDPAKTPVIQWSASFDQFASFISQTKVQPDQWHHIALVIGAPNEKGVSTQRIYLDGKRDGSRDNAFTGDGTTPLAFFLARPNEKTNSYGANGLIIDEVRISRSERYSGDFTVPSGPFIPDADIVALWHFDGDAKDSSGNELDGQIMGNVQFVDSTIGK